VTNVVDFHRHKDRPVAALKVAEQPAQPRLSEIEMREEWVEVLAAIWANPKNWRRSKQGYAHIDIRDLDARVVIIHDDGGYRWEIRWSNGREAVASKWIYVVESLAVDDAWDAIRVLG
jgi:hypothetical protein